MVGNESGEAAQERVKKEFEEPSFRVGKESVRSCYVARDTADLGMKLEQNSVTTLFEGTLVIGLFTESLGFVQDT